MGLRMAAVLDHQGTVVGYTDYDVVTEDPRTVDLGDRVAQPAT